MSYGSPVLGVQRYCSVASVLILHLQVLCLAAVLFRVMALSPSTFHFVSTRYVLLKKCWSVYSCFNLDSLCQQRQDNRLGCNPVSCFVIGTRFQFVKQIFNETDVIKLNNQIILSYDVPVFLFVLKDAQYKLIAKYETAMFMATNYFYSYTVHYRMCRNWPTTALSCMLLYLQDSCYMFRQGNAIIRERLGSLWVTSTSVCFFVTPLFIPSVYYRL
jgi:hypothetical protein